MKTSKLYKRHPFLHEIIQYAVWLYHRCNSSHGEVERLLAERNITVNNAAIRLGCNKFGSGYARRLKRRHQGYGDTFFNVKLSVKFLRALLRKAVEKKQWLYRMIVTAELRSNVVVQRTDPRRDPRDISIRKQSA